MLIILNREMDARKTAPGDTAIGDPLSAPKKWVELLHLMDTFSGKRHLVLVAITTFALVWTGTLWHDFFGIEVLPVLSQVVDSGGDFVVSPEQTLTGRLDGRTGAYQEPCACPSHVHSPPCMTRAKSTEVFSAVRLAVVQLISILPHARPSPEIVPSREPPSLLSTKVGPAFYIVNRTLLI